MREFAFEVAPLPVAEVAARNTSPDLHKAFRALVRRATGGTRGAVMEHELDRECEHMLFVSTAADVPELLQDASLLMEAGYSKQAATIFERITEMDPTRFEGWLGRARVTADPFERVNHLQKALYLKPGRELRGELAIARQNLQEYAYTLLDEGTAQSDPERMARAHQLFRQAVELDPGDERAWLGCARTADNLVEKMQYLERALKINPQNKEAQELRVIIGSFVHDEPKERWSLKSGRRGSVILGILLIGLVALFFALPWLLPPP
jgi:tetratricopeptide (TPR) repeat protein